MNCKAAAVGVWCFVVGLGLSGLARGQTASAGEMTASQIPGVVAGGTKVHQVMSWDPAYGGEGPVPTSDDGLLFVQQEVSKIIKIDKDGKSSTYLEKTDGTIALAYDLKGRLIGVGTRKPEVPPQREGAILVFAPTRSVLVDQFQGQPFKSVGDLVSDKKGGVYFVARVGPTAGKSAVYYLKADGQIMKVTEDVPQPNGIQLSPDEKVLYVANPPGEFVMAFDIESDHSVRNPRNFGRVAEPGKASLADGMAMDAAGRLYVAAVGGVHVLSPQGETLGIIPIPVTDLRGGGTSPGPRNLAFAGPGKKTLYVVTRGAAYKISMQAAGVEGRAK